MTDPHIISNVLVENRIQHTKTPNREGKIIIRIPLTQETNAGQLYGFLNRAITSNRQAKYEDLTTQWLEKLDMPSHRFEVRTIWPQNAKKPTRVEIHFTPKNTRRK